MLIGTFTVSAADDVIAIGSVEEFQYLSNDDTMLSEEGIKTLNAYALQGYNLIREFPLEEKPTSREEFLEAFNVAMQIYCK